MPHLEEKDECIVYNLFVWVKSSEVREDQTCAPNTGITKDLTFTTYASSELLCDAMDDSSSESSGDDFDICAFIGFNGFTDQSQVDQYLCFR